MLVALGFAGAGWVAWGLPERAEVLAMARRVPAETAIMRQRAREARASRQPVRREQTFVPLARISRNLIHAVIASEDQRFFGHVGVDWDAIRASAESDLRTGRVARGGSTITQQLAKNLFFGTEKSLARKLREVLVARWLEADLGKRRILELYLNLIEWGDGVYGCEAAARRHFGKPAADLSETEAAGLAGMIPNPRRIDPRKSPTRYAQAQRRVLWLMAQAGYLKRDLGGMGAEPPPVEEGGDTEPVEP
jgi:monofunctional biosynthetic peptidoglycan transglycosylase